MVVIGSFIFTGTAGHLLVMFVVISASMTQYSYDLLSDIFKLFHCFELDWNGPNDSTTKLGII